MYSAQNLIREYGQPIVFGTSTLSSATRISTREMMYSFKISRAEGVKFAPFPQGNSDIKSIDTLSHFAIYLPRYPSSTVKIICDKGIIWTAGDRLLRGQ